MEDLALNHLGSLGKNFFKFEITYISHVIILIILKIYLLTSKWSQPITGQNIYKQQPLFGVEIITNICSNG